MARGQRPSTQRPDTAAAGTEARAGITLAVCFLGAIAEGFNLQAAGVAGPGMRVGFGLTAAQLGWLFSASVLGLLPGAVLGGRLADRFGRKLVLVYSLALFGALTLLTALSQRYQELLLSRFFAGVGLGGAMPALIALSSESARERSRTLAVSIMYAGMPAGGLVTALVGYEAAGSGGWRTIFFVGGTAALLIVPLMLIAMPESRAYADSRGIAAAPGGRAAMVESSYSALFGAGRAGATLLLWLGYFFTLVILYLLQNWLPTLTLDRGYTAHTASLAQMLFNVGGVIGILIMGLLMDRGPRGIAVGVVYGVLILSLLVLARVTAVPVMLTGGFGAGFCSIGAQLVLYGIAPEFYPTLLRGTGVGAAVAVGRLGSVAGPVIAASILSAGLGANAALVAVIPASLIAAVAVEALVLKRSTVAQPSTISGGAGWS